MCALSSTICIRGKIVISEFECDELINLIFGEVVVKDLGDNLQAVAAGVVLLTVLVVFDFAVTKSSVADVALNK